MKNKMFNLTVFGIIGIVLLLAVVLLVYEKPTGKVVSTLPAVDQSAQLQSPPLQGENCMSSASCRTLQLCSTVSDGLYTDGVGMGCVNAEENADVPYCGHLTRAQDSASCDYQDKNPRCVCL